MEKNLSEDKKAVVKEYSRLPNEKEKKDTCKCFYLFNIILYPNLHPTATLSHSQI